MISYASADSGSRIKSIANSSDALDLARRALPGEGRAWTESPQTSHFSILDAEGKSFTAGIDLGEAAGLVRVGHRGRLAAGGRSGEDRSCGGLGLRRPATRRVAQAARGTATVGALLQGAGYVTGAVGKWGLGGPTDEGHPNLQGFDHWYGYLCQRQAHNYYPTHLWRNTAWDTLSNAYFRPHQKLEVAF